MTAKSNRVLEAIERTKDATLIEVIDLDGSIRCMSPTYVELYNLAAQEDLTPEERETYNNWFAECYW